MLAVPLCAEKFHYSWQELQHFAGLCQSLMLVHQLSFLHARHSQQK